MRRRKKIPADIETEALVKSGRRCCFCFGLNGDYTLKKGQITHLDHNSANFALENLAWMCMNHHDEYDSKTSQSKGMTLSEAKRYRELLYRRVQADLDNNLSGATIQGINNTINPPSQPTIPSKNATRADKARELHRMCNTFMAKFESILFDVPVSNSEDGPESYLYTNFLAACDCFQQMQEMAVGVEPFLNPQNVMKEPLYLIRRELDVYGYHLRWYVGALRDLHRHERAGFVPDHVVSTLSDETEKAVGGGRQQTEDKIRTQVDRTKEILAAYIQANAP